MRCASFGKAISISNERESVLMIREMSSSLEGKESLSFPIKSS